MKAHAVRNIVAPDRRIVERDVRRALSEDIGNGDVTAALLPEDALASASVVTREAAILAGRDWFETCFRILDPGIEIGWHFVDGDDLSADSTVCELWGRARALVSGERCALNFLQTLSGTATTTARYVAALGSARTRILDTRKTLPGLRHAQKYAVRCGGGENHRIGLFDAFLIKENHIAAAGSLTAAIRQAQAMRPDILLEVEVENLRQLQEALEHDLDRIMLDEFSLDDIGHAVVMAAGKIPLEVSGGVGLNELPALAGTGVDYISIGALTKHLHAIDLSMRLLDVGR